MKIGVIRFGEQDFFPYLSSMNNKEKQQILDLAKDYARDYGVDMDHAYQMALKDFRIKGNNE